jgi:hypothetical protein
MKVDAIVNATFKTVKEFLDKTDSSGNNETEERGLANMMSTENRLAKTFQTFIILSNCI